VFFKFRLQKGDAYPKLNQVISINILDFVLLEAYDNSVTVMLDERGRIEGAFEMGEKSGLQRAARAMKQKNMQAGLIAELTGLSINEVESLN
jgi:hypothetical protein